MRNGPTGKSSSLPLTVPARTNPAQITVAAIRTRIPRLLRPAVLALSFVAGPTTASCAAVVPLSWAAVVAPPCSGDTGASRVGVTAASWSGVRAVASVCAGASWSGGRALASGGTERCVDVRAVCAGASGQCGVRCGGGRELASVGAGALWFDVRAVASTCCGASWPMARVRRLRRHGSVVRGRHWFATGFVLIRAHWSIRASATPLRSAYRVAESSR